MIILRTDDERMFDVMTHDILIDYLKSRGWVKASSEYQRSCSAAYHPGSIWRTTWIPIKRLSTYNRGMSEGLYYIAKAEEKTELILLIDILKFEIDKKGYTDENLRIIQLHNALNDVKNAIDRSNGCIVGFERKIW